MAFDTPLEADRPAQLNLLHTFIRAPVIGTLMWIFGGDVAKELEERDRCTLVDAAIDTSHLRTATDNEEDSSSVSSDVPDHASDDEKWPEVHDSSAVGGQGPRSPPMKSRKDIASSATAALAQMSDFAPAVAFDKESSAQGDKNGSSQAGRQMSWSDESGQSLVEYFDVSNKSIPLHEPSSRTTRPLKSAMRRAKSGGVSRCMNLADSHCALSKQNDCISSSAYFNAPKGGSNRGGYISPQWGWYISTTPPAEKFAASSNTQSKKSEVVEDIDSIIFTTASLDITGGHDAMPTFTRKGMGRIGRVGWHVC